MTLPALAFCCLYASGVLGPVAPKSWRPPEVSQAELASHARQAAQAARAKSAAQARLALAAKLKTLGRPPGSRNFGVAIPGKELSKWYAGGGNYEGAKVHPRLLMTFQSWGASKKRDRMPTKYLNEDETVGIQAQMFTWEPWRSPAIGSLAAQQETAQPKYSNQAIADGRRDRYIKKWADAVKKFPRITVYIRFGHEMNGNWYPWSLDPPEYVLAWQHIWNIFHQQQVTNARFVWSPDFGEGLPYPGWWQHLMAYWPGKEYVNDIGTTVINFGGSEFHPVDQFTPLINLVHARLKMPMMLTEVNTERHGRAQWMLDLANYVGHRSWIKSVVLSQDRSFGAANTPNVGNLSWQVWTDNSPRARRAFKALVGAATKNFGSHGTGVTADSGT